MISKHYSKRLLLAIKKNRFAVFALTVITLTCAAALASYFFTPYDPAATLTGKLWQPSSAEHLLGTDGSGRDTLSRLLAGSRITIAVALSCGVCAALLSILLAALTVRGPRILQGISSVVIDVLIAFPTLLVAIMLVAAIGNGFWTVLISLSLGGGVALSRNLRAQLAQVLKLDYVMTATVSGINQHTVFWRHAVRSVLPTVYTQGALVAGSAVLAESSLSYLGFGLAHDTVSWGKMLAQSQQAINLYPLATFVPGIALTLFALSCFILGDILRYTADPRATAASPLDTPKVTGIRNTGVTQVAGADPVASASPVTGADLVAARTPAAQTAQAADATVAANQSVSAYLELRKLSIANEQGQKIVGPLHLSVKKGSRTALIGASGSGKTITALAIAQLLPQHLQTRGSIFFEARDTTQLTDDECAKLRGAEIAYVFQEPKTALNPVMKIGSQITTALRHHYRLSPPETAAELQKLAQQVGLAPHLLKKYPHELSGGQRQRAAIAAALSADPQLLIADEITSSLDATVRVQILELLKNLTSSGSRTLLFITHDMAQVRQLADHVVVMDQGAIVEANTAAEFFARPQHRVSKQLLAASLIKTTVRGTPVSGTSAAETPASNKTTPNTAARNTTAPEASAPGTTVPNTEVS
ncbi:dipeptide/oligopeptide/nickel ABC transporter permease/ATP-binding protein [Canibacter sp. lx-45]|uniref:dipeptide/oligopeptide/nickel ABC transporter permease/ATP-binding protein n=1 Tax=Canibacter zhuwentaonis TaxID=2837491 RepID=UPI001BDC6E17|nr:dipeptide/oligopeptide/nickel ABC transporter permease/ATP-binding protein [Canibacter zhuwentaonis]MBT1034754.1 dipeptide/oligopeptide/nickel ABC transporter permease/ATP-binding protein [Canibacter zhuwentaonis]